jgi:tripartite-type tricarboxylate transporter receptor subunit TctC
MTLGHRLTTIVVTAAFAVGVPVAASQAADPVADFYKGKQIRLVVGGAQGTSYDAWAHTLAKYLPRYIPGRPTVVVKNMPGSGHLKAAKYLFNDAPRDGSVIGTFSRNIPASALQKNPEIPFDVRRFNWLSSTDMPNRVCVAAAGRPVQKAGDLFIQELDVGSTGPGTPTQNMPMLLNGLLGTKFAIREGFDNTDDVYAAMERDEVGGICQTLRGIETDRPGWIAEGRLKVLFNLEKKPLAGLGAPSIHDFAQTAEQKQVLSYFSGAVELGRPFAAPPNTPSDRVQALRRAFAKAMANPELRREVSKDKVEFTSLSGEELAERIEELASLPSEIVDRTNALLGLSGQ